MNRKEKELEIKRRLMEATEAVFSHRGFAQATVDEIVALAGTGKGTLFYYFDNKNNLFYTLVCQKHSKLMEQMWSVANNKEIGIEEQLIGILTVWVEFLRKNKVLWQVLCFEMTCMNRGFSGVEDENGNIRLATSWGKLPPHEEQETILRYHRLLADELKPIKKVYTEGIRENFFNETANHEDIAKHMFLAIAMIVFFHPTAEVEKTSAADFAAGFVNTRLYGLAKQKS